MDLEKVKSLDNATDRELLLMILSTQVQLCRRVEFLYSKVTSQEYGSVDSLCDDIANKFDTFAKRLDEAIERQKN